MEERIPMNRTAAHRAPQLAYSYSLFSDADELSPKICRDFVRVVLLTLGWSEAVTPAVLCTSELVTNVHLHTKGTAMLHVQVGPASVRISVYDEDPTPVALRELPPMDDEACWGRGLALVAGTADAWGVAADRGGRYAKGVWFELAG
ncbi:ATP-binding protein [Streptomyces sp. NPDC051561]|uniref:ATP-binding protein n=1 Tax=Streptomyces sp. NPDC051561 TaxID=3365658 RepID=UPI00379302F6